MKRVIISILVAAAMQGVALIGPSAASAATACDPGDDIGPVAVSDLPRRYRSAASAADVNGNGLVCGQSYYNDRTGKLVGIHWSDDLEV